MIYLLLISLVIVLLLAYFASNKNICNPSVILVAMFLLSSIIAVNYKIKYGLDIHMNTVALITGLSIVFVAVSFIWQYLYSKQYSPTSIKSIKPISVPIALFAIVVLIDILACYMLHREVIQIALTFGWNPADSLDKAQQIYRDVTSYDSLAKVSFITDKLKRFCQCSAYVFELILIYNIATNLQSWKKSWFYIVPVILGCFVQFLNSGRLEALLIVGAGVYAFAFISGWLKNWDTSKNARVIARLAIVLIITLVAFYFLRLVVGRSGSTETDFFDYLAMYAGAPIYLLDMYLALPGASPTIPGLETFYSLISNLNNYGIVDYGQLPIIHLEFRYYGALNMGNVYTAYRRWMADFGVPGCLLLQLVIASFYSVYFHKMATSRNLQSFSFLFFVFIIPLLMLMPIDSVITRRLFAFGLVFDLFFLGVLYYGCIWYPLNKRANIREIVAGRDGKVKIIRSQL